ncbi:MAG: type VI secretion system baseplate subunit TssF [Myxococcales bacterium]|nr:type VI secretion system baseplate subunit TssF [Myxococcales bacterium]
MSFNQYYKSELATIHELARGFAEANPATAGLLKERGNDPDVERLIEAFAFQAAGIRARMDNVLPGIVQGLAELLLPHYLRPLPAATIVEFAPNLRALRARHTIPAGRMLTTKPVEGTPCRFRTSFDVDLLPFEVADAKLDDAVAARPVVRLTLKLTEAGKSALPECGRVRFYLHHSEPTLPAMLMLWLTRHLTGVSIVGAPGSPPLQLDKSAVEPVGLSRNLSVYPWPDTAPSGFRLLFEYFLVPMRFHFFDLVGLDKVRANGTEITVNFEFERPPPLPAAVRRENVRLYCTPALNLFECTAEPVTYSPLEREHLLRADGVNPRHMEVYEVRSVVGVSRGTSARRNFLPFFRFSHANVNQSPFYSIRQAPAIDGGTDVFLVLDEARGALPPAHEETISVDMLCTNRSLVRGLQPGAVTEVTPGAMFRAYENITPVNTPVRVPLGSDALWRLLSHLALGQRGLKDLESLKGLLRLYDVQGLNQMEDGRIGERQIEAIRSVEREMVTRMVLGVPVRAVRTRVELDEAGFPSVGNAFLFSALLSELSGSLTELNSASEVVATLSASKMEFRWPVQIGV